MESRLVSGLAFPPDALQSIFGDAPTAQLTT